MNKQLIADKSFDFKKYFEEEDKRKLRAQYAFKDMLSLIAACCIGLFSQIGTLSFVSILELQNLAVSKILFVILMFQGFIVYFIVYMLLHDYYKKIFEKKGLEVEE